MITKVSNISTEQLNRICTIIGEAFVTNELFHNWGDEQQRREYVMRYMAIYVDYVYRCGELFANDEMTGFIGLEDSKNVPIMPRIAMLFRLFRTIPFHRIKSLLHFAGQISGSNDRYAKQRHLDALMVCVEQSHQGQGIASELINFAKQQADKLNVPLLFDTDMKDYANMYRHFGCELYNTVTADNGVTRYSLCYKGDK